MSLQPYPARTASCKRNRQDRSGMIVVAALTCLLIASTIVVSMVHSAIRIRRQLHTERDLRQTEQLLSAGADRALGQLARDPEFIGDQWELPAEAISGRGAGRVTTEITRSNDIHWNIRVVAEFPLDRDFTVRRSQSFDVSNSTTQSEE